jgi:hypothetical protein
MKLIYIAGALNGDAPTYIRNAHKMTEYANKVMKEGFAVYNPANDFIQGIVSGELEYIDYVKNTMAFMLVCDAVALVPDNHINSNGTRQEIVTARKNGKKVLYTFDEVLKFKGGD